MPLYDADLVPTPGVLNCASLLPAPAAARNPAIARAGALLARVVLDGVDAYSDSRM
jgi:hypothetical protein